MQDRCLACHAEVAEEREIESSMHGFFNSLYTCRGCHPEHRGAAASLTDFDRVVFPHQDVGFVLTAHRELPPSDQPDCRSCHPESVREFDAAECRTCHEQKDAAGTQKHINMFHSDCLRCHDGADRYGVDFDHQQTRFPLEGAHTDALCEDCHQVASSIADLQAASRQCVDCHADADAHAGQLSAMCNQCHLAVNWQTVSVDHELTEYPLIGAHTSVQCQSCHIDKQWVGLETTCDACHDMDDAHEGQFGAQCEICHQETIWHETTFDHADTALPLIGGHSGITCESCHLETEYTGLSATCVDCHVDPEFHAGYFGTECSKCHTVNAWFPVTYLLTHDDFPLIHGGGSPSCKTCHPSSLSTYTCYGCHEHTPEKAYWDHKRYAGRWGSGKDEVENVDDCYRCHPTGYRWD